MGHWYFRPDSLKSKLYMSQCRLDWPDIEPNPAIEEQISSKSKLIPTSHEIRLYYKDRLVDALRIVWHT